jgi:hypothetical protein
MCVNTPPPLQERYYLHKYPATPPRTLLLAFEDFRFLHRHSSSSVFIPSLLVHIKRGFKMTGSYLQHWG